MTLSEKEMFALPHTAYGTYVHQEPEYGITTLYIPLYSRSFYDNLLSNILSNQKNLDEYSRLRSGEDLTNALSTNGATYYADAIASAKPVNYYEEVMRDGLFDKDSLEIRSIEETVLFGELQTQLAEVIERDKKKGTTDRKKYYSLQQHMKDTGKHSTELQHTLIDPAWGDTSIIDELGSGDLSNAGVLQQFTLPQYQDVSFPTRYIAGDPKNNKPDLYIVNFTDVFEALKTFGRTLPERSLKEFDKNIQKYKDSAMDKFGGVLAAAEAWMSPEDLEAFSLDLSEIIRSAIEKTIPMLEQNAEAQMSAELKRDAGFNLFEEYDYTKGTWALDKKAKTIKRKPRVSVESAIKQQGAWSYNNNEEVIVDIDAFEFTPVVIQARLPNLQYRVRTSAGSEIIIDEKDIVDAVEELF